MPNYRVVTKHQKMKIPAARFERDGGGVRFYDANDRPVASFADGTVVDVINLDLVEIESEPEGGAE